jgi:hypothetical protein
LQKATEIKYNSGTQIFCGILEEVGSISLHLALRVTCRNFVRDPEQGFRDFSQFLQANPKTESQIQNQNSLIFLLFYATLFFNYDNAMTPETRKFTWGHSLNVLWDTP